MCLGDTLHSGWGYNSAPVLSVGKSGIRAGKNPHLRNQIRQSCTPTSFLFRVQHPLYSVDHEAASWDYSLGTAGMNLVCQDSSSGCFKSLPPLSQSDSQGLSSADTPAGPMGWEQNRGSHDEMTHNLGVGWLPSCVLFFLLEEPDAQGRPSCMVLHWPEGWGNVVNMAQGVLRPHTHVLGSSQCCFVIEWLLVVLSVRANSSKTCLSFLVMSLPPCLLIAW